VTAATHAPALSDVQIEALARLPDAESRAQFLSRHAHLVDAAVVEQLAEAVRERVRVDVHQAVALSDAAVLIARETGADEPLARALRAKANAHWFCNELRPAVDLFDQAAALFEAVGNDAELGRTLSSSIQSRILLGDYGQALEAAGRARAIFTALGDDRRLARLDLNVANVFHRQDRLDEALESYERAYERLLAHQDAEGIGVALHNMAVCLIVLNDFERALSTYERAREHCARAGMPVLVAQADYNIAYLYYFRGDYSRALDMLRAARVACQKVDDPYHSALCNLDQSDIYLELNLSAEAAEMATEARAQFDALGNGYEAARSVTNLAIALGQQGEIFRALELFGQARAQFEREQNAVWPSVIDLYQALVLSNAGRFFEARRLCVSALTFFRSSNLHRKTILCELLLARLELRTDEPVQALAHCREALARAEAIDAPVLDYQAYFLKGQIEEAAGDAASAYESYQVARTRLEALRSVLWGEDLKIAFMTTKLVVYERLVDLCLAREADDRQAAEVFGYIEQAKSRSLRDLFLERTHPTQSADASQSDLVRQIRTLREELNWYYHRIELEQLGRDDRSPERLDHLQRQLRDHEQTFIRVLRELPVDDRELVGLPDTTPISPADLRGTVGDDAALVEYFATGDRILAAVLTADGLTIVPLTTVSSVRRLLRALQFQLSKFQYGAEYLARVDHGLLEATQEHLQTLHEELLAPLQLGARRRLVIVPHDLLHYVPFHALFDGRSYLAESTAVSYAPSASIYALCCRRAAPASETSLILGVPDERAPFIADEVRAVAGILPQAELLMGAGATADALRQRGAASRIVHIATHGYFREDNPLFSGVRLGDSYLTLHDLYDLRLPVDLISLSGCGTGLQAIAAGDELRGLVRGLLAAGARSVLVTLWNVNDRSTAEFMVSFYRHLGDGVDKAAAVQMAMADLRQHYPHPYYWAPFILVGADGGPAA
jgi:CHAT domain-containing protein